MPTHGSLTKAGKVRNQTPKIAPQAKKKQSPIARNLHNFTKRFTNAPTMRSDGRNFRSGRGRR